MRMLCTYTYYYFRIGTSVCTPEEGLDAFTIDTAAVEKMDATDDPEGLTEAEGTSSAGEAGSVLGGDCKIYEYDPAIYEDIAQAEDTTGIVFITRSGQEGQDQKFDAYADGTPHYLALSENEKGTIRAAKEICGKVVVVLVSSAPMEMGDLMSGELEADAILWVGHPGEKGFSTLSSLLDGDVNPSGKTVDTWAADFTKDPSYQSLGENTYSNFTITSGALIDGGEYAAMYNEYMEDMYMGYRYYETADAMDAGFVYGTLDGQGASVEAGAVCYPFGYGLSYTTFSQELLSLEDDGYTITAKVKVTNTGDVAGKDVVQLYYGAPYTQLDQENKIEKPVFGPVVALSSLSNNLNQTLASGERVLSLLEETPLVEEIPGDVETAKISDTKIFKDETEEHSNNQDVDSEVGVDYAFAGATVENVTFAYEEETILDNYSLKLEPGKITGIHGASGSGKSTLLKLLMRFWDVQAGSVSVDGTDVRKIPTKHLRDMESYVTQETHLFHDSIANNIAIAKQGASREEIMEAAKKASIHDFIMTLPKGYDTEVGELGDTLSGGEKQRIGIARAFLHDSPLILLDEPTSNLDSLNEGIILKSLKESALKKTVVLVSHRVSTMNVADVVYEMENGRIS